MLELDHQGVQLLVDLFWQVLWQAVVWNYVALFGLLFWFVRFGFWLFDPVWLFYILVNTVFRILLVQFAHSCILVFFPIIQLSFLFVIVLISFPLSISLDSIILQGQEGLDYFFNYVAMFIHIGLISHQKISKLLKELHPFVIYQQYQSFLCQCVSVQYWKYFVQTVLIYRCVFIYPVKQNARKLFWFCQVLLCNNFCRHFCV